MFMVFIVFSNSAKGAGPRGLFSLFQSTAETMQTLVFVLFQSTAETMKTLVFALFQNTAETMKTLVC